MPAKRYDIERITKEELLVKLRDWTPATVLTAEEATLALELQDEGLVDIYLDDGFNIEMVVVHEDAPNA